MTGPDEPIKHVADAASILTVIGTLTNVLPHAAALFTIIWTSIRIYETDTVQRWLNKKQG
jgi:hypothetical protein